MTQLDVAILAQFNRSGGRSQLSVSQGDSQEMKTALESQGGNQMLLTAQSRPGSKQSATGSRRGTPRVSQEQEGDDSKLFTPNAGI